MTTFLIGWLKNQRHKAQSHKRQMMNRKLRAQTKMIKFKQTIEFR